VTLLLRRAILVGAALATLCLSFYVGGVVGYAQGAGTQLGLIAPGHAVTTASALSALRAGNADVAFQILEADLDADILSYAIVTESNPSAFDLIGIGSYNPCLMDAVAKYRAEFPSPSPTVEVRDAVTSHLSKYATGSSAGSESRRLTRRCS